MMKQPCMCFMHIGAIGNVKCVASEDSLVRWGWDSGDELKGLNYLIDISRVLHLCRSFQVNLWNAASHGP